MASRVIKKSIENEIKIFDLNFYKPLGSYSSNG